MNDILGYIVVCNCRFNQLKARLVSAFGDKVADKGREFGYYDSPCRMRIMCITFQITVNHSYLYRGFMIVFVLFSDVQ